MTKEEIQYEAQSIIQEWGSNDSAPYVEFVEKLASMELPESPSNLDEATEISDLEAKNLADDYITFLAAGLTKNEPRPIGPRWMKKLASDRFKAGAEWMAGQGVSVDGKVIMDFSEPYDIINRRLIAKLGDALLEIEPGEVVVQIRKK